MHDSLALLKLYTPTLFDCVTSNEHRVNRVTKKYDERLATVVKAIDENGVFSAMTCIFDLLWKASENNEAAKEFLVFIEKTVKQALTSTVGSANKQMEKLVLKMMISFGEERSEYKNHFAEIAVISKLIHQGGFELKAIEKRLPNGNTMDFEIVKDEIVTLIEVYNMDFDIDKIINSDDFKHFIENRLLKKLTKKLEGLDRKEIDCQLVPVLWGDIMSLVKFRDTFEYFKKAKIIAPFMMVAQYRDQSEGSIVYDFESVEQFLLRIERPLNGL